MKSKRKKIILAILLCLFVWASYYVIVPVSKVIILGGLNYSGRCDDTGEWYTQQQKMDIAIHTLITKGLDKSIRGRSLIEHKFIPSFTSIEQLKEEYPNCCKILESNDPILKYGPEIDFINRLFGASDDAVKFHFTEKRIYKGQTEIKEELVALITKPDNCGEMWDLYSSEAGGNL